MDFILTMIINAVADAVTGCFNLLIDLFQNGIGFSGKNGRTTLGSFFALFNFCQSAYTVFLWAGFFILFTICVFQLFKAFFGNIVEAESPLPLVVKTIVFTVMIAFSQDICQFIIGIGAVPYEILNKLTVTEHDYKMDYDAIAGAGMFSTVDGGETLSIGALGLLFFVIFLIMLIKEFFKLLIEIVERYVILGLLTTVAPLCIACGASKATAKIFKNFIMMYISQVIVMSFSVFFLRAFSYAIGNWLKSAVGSTATFMGESFTPPNFFVQGLMVLAWLKLGQRVDSYMSQLGLSVAQAGGTADTFMAGVHQGLQPGSAASGISNAITNKMLGTNFNKNNRGNENMWQALKNGNLSKKSGILEAARVDKSNNVTSGNRRLAGEKKAKSDRAAYSAKELKSMMADRQNTYGGSSSNGGYAVANGVKDAFGLDKDLKAQPGSYIHGNKVHAEYLDKDGNLQVYEGMVGDTNGNTKLGTLEGKGAMEGTNLSLVSGSTDGAIASANGLVNQGADFSKNSNDFEKVEGAQPQMEEAKVANDTFDNNVSGENAIHWDNDGNPIEPPGEEPQRADFPEGAEGDKAFEEAHAQWQAQSDAYNNADMVAPDGNVYEAGSLDNATHWDENGNAINPPGEEPQRSDFPEGAEGDQAFAEAHEAWEADKEAYDNASLIAPDGNIYEAGAMAMEDGSIAGEQIEPANQPAFDAEGNEVSLNDVARFDEDGNIVAPPGEEPQREDFAEGLAGDVAFAEAHNAWSEQSEAYNNASLTDSDGHMYKADANGEKDGMLYSEAPQLSNNAGESVAANETMRYSKDADGNVQEIAPPVAPQRENFKSEADFNAAQNKYEQDQKAYNNASMIAPDGVAYRAEGGQRGEALTDSNFKNSGNTFAKVASGAETFKQSATGNNAATVSTQGKALMQATGNHNGVTADRAVLEAGGTRGHIQDNNGNLAYNNNTGQFVSADNAINSDGKIADGIAGTYRNSSGQAVSESEALQNGKLKDGYTSEVPRFSAITSNSEAGRSFAAQQQSGEGIQLDTRRQKADGTYGAPTGHVTRYNADGTENAFGDFVRTMGQDGQPGQLVSASTFVSGADGNVATHALVDTSNGFQELNTNSSGQIQRYNRAGQEDANGEMVMDNYGNKYSASSFGINNEGQVQGYARSVQQSDSYDSLVSNSAGRPISVDANGNQSDNGQYYLKNTDLGTEVVPKSNYETNSAGETKAYKNTASEYYGDVVATVNSAGEQTGYARLSNPQAESSPMTYDRVPDSSPQGFHYEPNANNEGMYVSTVNSEGQQQYSQVRAYNSSEPIDTYKSKNETLTMSELDGSATPHSVVGYSRAEQGTTGEYCRDTSGGHHKISGFTEDGSMQRYSRQGNEMVPDQNGAYAQVEGAEPGQRNYVPVASNDTYMANYATDNGIKCTGDSSNNEVLFNIPKSNITESKTPGVLNATIDGRNFELQPTAMYGYTNDMTNQNTKKVTYNGKEYLMKESNYNFNVQSNREITRTYVGDQAARKAEDCGYQTSNTKTLTAMESGQGTVFMDSSVPRRRVEPKDGGEAYWVQNAMLTTDRRPNGSQANGDFRVSRNQKTGREVYQVPVQVRYNSEVGGQASLTFGTTIRENNTKMASRGPALIKDIKKAAKAIFGNPTNQMRGK